MELKATLNKPYTKEQRIDFIVKQNHTNGYEIKETDTALEAWGFDSSEIEEAEKKRQIAQLKAQLNEYDLQSIRPLRAKEAGTATQDDLNKLAELEELVGPIRQKIQELNNAA